MYNSDIKEYEEFEDELRQTLEQQYNINIMTGHKVEAHENLKALMRYRLIPETDPRTSIKTKIFSPEIDVTDPNNWDYFDYRRKDSTRFIGRYIFAELASNKVMDVYTIEHWGKRVEGNYEGDVRIPSHIIKVKLSQINHVKSARDVFIEMAEYLESMNYPLTGYNDMIPLVEKGVIRLYKVEIMGNTLSKYRTLAYVMIKMNDAGNLAARTVIKYEALYNSWIDIDKFISQLNITLLKCSSVLMDCANIIDTSKAIEKQKEMIKSDEDASIANKKAVERYLANKASKSKKDNNKT